MRVVEGSRKSIRRTVNGCLTAQLLEHFGSSCKSISRFTDGDVENEFLDSQFPHGVLGLVLLAFGLCVFQKAVNRGCSIRSRTI